MEMKNEFMQLKLSKKDSCFEERFDEIDVVISNDYPEMNITFPYGLYCIAEIADIEILSRSFSNIGSVSHEF